MKRDQVQFNQSNQSASVRLNALLDEIKNIGQEIDEINKQTNTALDEINMKVDESIIKIEKICSDLDQIEKEAGDEMDKLILQQAETLGEE